PTAMCACDCAVTAGGPGHRVLPRSQASFRPGPEAWCEPLATYDLLCDMGCVATDTVDQSRLAIVEPRQTNEEQPMLRRHAPSLDGVAVVIKDRQFDQGEVEFVARCPDHIGDAGGVEVKFSYQWLVEAVAQDLKRLFGHRHSCRGNVGVDLFHEVGFEL